MPKSHPPPAPPARKSTAPQEVHAHGGSVYKLALAALGVVYGDIGTSPLYALKECVTPPHGVDPTPENVLGLLSLIFWSITLVVVVKYLVFVVRADNQGEGGVLALLALVVLPEDGAPSKRRGFLLLLGLFGAALLYGDGMITPAISVLSAVEGLEVATTAFTPLVVPITCGILIALFLVQRRGTAGIGAVFGPATLIWFGAIALAGIPQIVERPDVLLAVSPVHAVHFFAHHGWHGFLVLGSVVLCVTGGEALYADMGHFGRRAIRWAWYGIVFPALLINYFGQGALLLDHPEAAKNPFYGLVHGGSLYAMVAIATVATVVASQALISGAYSLTRQAVQLGYSPRVSIVHTSGTTEGQIYVPEINNLLMVSCVALVLAFRASGALAAAYGIAVTGTMAITSMLFYVVARTRWGWRKWQAAALVALFLTFDLSFLGANLAKITQGGWVPIAVGVGMFTIMTTWKRGRALLGERLRAASLPLDAFLEDVATTKPHRVKGTAVFLNANPTGTPVVLLHHFKHNKVLHEQVILLSVLTDRIPEVPATERVKVRDLGEGFWQVSAHYGFMQTPSVPEILRQCTKSGLKTKENDTSFYLGRETLLATPGGGLARWRKKLFGFLSRNARPATAFFGLPPNRVVEMGAQIEL